MASGDPVRGESRSHENQNSLPGPAAPVALCRPLSQRPRGVGTACRRTRVLPPPAASAPLTSCVCLASAGPNGDRLHPAIGSFRDPPAAVPYVSVMNKHRLRGWGAGKWQLPVTAEWTRWGRHRVGDSVAKPGQQGGAGVWSPVLTKRDPGGQRAFLETGNRT